MHLERKFELSIHKHFRDLIDNSVDVVEDEPEEDLVTPTVAFICDGKHKYPFEHGARDRDAYSWTVLIYANNKTERRVLTTLVYDNLEDCIIVYDYDESEPLPVLGTLLISNIASRYVRAPTESTDKLRYVGIVNFNSTFQEAF